MLIASNRSGARPAARFRQRTSMLRLGAPAAQAAIRTLSGRARRKVSRGASRARQRFGWWGLLDDLGEVELVVDESPSRAARPCSKPPCVAFAPSAPESRRCATFRSRGFREPEVRDVSLPRLVSPRCATFRSGAFREPEVRDVIACLAASLDARPSIETGPQGRAEAAHLSGHGVGASMVLDPSPRPGRER